jgi:hypothetical protein
MDQQGRDMLHSFVGLLNVGIPHPLDWKRFYDFTIYAYRLGQDAFDGFQVRAVLAEEGLTPDQATRFVVFYEKALGLLQRYDEQGR